MPLADVLDRRLRLPMPKILYKALVLSFYARGATDARR